MSIPSVCDAIPGNLLDDCGFEAGGFPPWTVTNNIGNTLVEPFSFGPGLHSGTYFAALGNVLEEEGVCTISQTVTSSAGSLLTIEFWFITSQFASAYTFVAKWNGVTLVDLSQAAGYTPTPYVQYTFTKTSTGSDTISFESACSDDFCGLDDVSVVQTLVAITNIAYGGASVAYV